MRPSGVDDLADDGRLLEAGQPGQVDAALGVAGADQHAALAGAQAVHVALAATRSSGVVRGSMATWTVRARSKAEVPVVMPVRASIGRERRAHAAGVRRRPGGSRWSRSQMAADIARQTMPQPLRDHEVDRLGRDLLGGDDQVALVLAVLVIDQDDHAPVAQLLEGLLDGAERGGSWDMVISGWHWRQSYCRERHALPRPANNLGENSLSE